jgi:hypothetical protein
MIRFVDDVFPFVYMIVDVQIFRYHTCRDRYLQSEKRCPAEFTSSPFPVQPPCRQLPTPRHCQEVGTGQ